MARAKRVVKTRTWRQQDADSSSDDDDASEDASAGASNVESDNPSTAPNNVATAAAVAAANSELSTLNNVSAAAANTEQTAPNNAKKRGPATKYTGWWKEMKDLSKRHLVILNSDQEMKDPETDLPYPVGQALICVLCRDHKGKSTGLINLRRPYSEPYWISHRNGKKHRTAVQHQEYLEEQIAKGKGKRKKAQQISSFFPKKQKTNDGEVANSDKSKRKSPPEVPKYVSLFSHFCLLLYTTQNKTDTSN